MPNQTNASSNRASAHSAALARLLPLWPHEISDLSTDGRKRRVALLQRALRAERQRGLAGHWTYDLSRHAGLLACLRAEVCDLKRMEAGATRSSVLAKQTI